MQLIVVGVQPFGLSHTAIIDSAYPVQQSGFARFAVLLTLELRFAPFRERAQPLLEVVALEKREEL
jgi:hypothetical protein